ncbi:hypothetical protein C8233_03745 [Halomonas sp. SF2003]|nr:hypothetical protein C8233_03745 [Halomonas sp. SF2003]
MTESKSAAPLSLPTNIPSLSLYDSRVGDYCNIMKAAYYEYRETSQWLCRHRTTAPSNLWSVEFRTDFYGIGRRNAYAGHTTVVFAGLLLEAAANSAGCHFFGDDYQRIYYLDVPTKWEYLLAGLYGHRLDRSRALYGDLIKQQKARNALVHSKAKRLDQESIPTALGSAARKAEVSRVEDSYRAVARLSFAVRQFSPSFQVEWNHLLPSFDTRRDPWLKSEIPEAIREEVCVQLGQLRANVAKCV